MMKDAFSSTKYDLLLIEKYSLSIKMYIFQL